MKMNEFQRSIVSDLAPRGRRCEWCGKLAEHQWTVIGGKHHNQGGYFCASCAQEFAQMIHCAITDATPIQMFVPSACISSSAFN